MDKVKDEKQYESLLLQQNAQKNGASVRTHIDSNNFIYTNNLNDPLSLAFKLFFRFDTTHGLLAPKTYINSAAAYLERIGQSDRSKMCEEFIELLKNINSVNPWLFQTLEGLDKILTKKPWDISNEDSSISIGTLETVEMIMQTLISMYRQIAMDEVRGVWVLPVNLRRFDLSIYVYPSGSYMVMDDDTNALGSLPNAKRSYSGETQELTTTNVVETYYIKSPDIYNHVCYDLSECEFDIWASGSTFLTPSNASNSEPTLNNLSFTFRRVKNSYRFYRILGDTVYSDYALALYAATQTTAEEQDSVWKKLAKQFFNKSIAPVRTRAEDIQKKITVLEKVGNEEKRKLSIDSMTSASSTVLQGLAETAFDMVSREISSRLQGMFLGNVYGVSADTFLGALTSTSSSEFIYNATRSINSLSNVSVKLKNGENVYSKL